MAIEPYMILFYRIKYGDIGFFYYTMQEITVVLQTPVVNKLKYARAILQ